MTMQTGLYRMSHVNMRALLPGHMQSTTYRLRDSSTLRYLLITGFSRTQCCAEPSRARPAPDCLMKQLQISMQSETTCNMLV